MRQSPEQTSFNGGEYSRRMKGRRDIDGYRSSCQNMENWVPTAQGAMIRRTGSFFGSGTGGQLEPPPTPPDPPNFIQPPSSYVTDGEFHAWSVRRRMDNDYTGPLIRVVDPNNAASPQIDIGSEVAPDGNGVYWIDETQILQAFVDTGQDPSMDVARLSIIKIYDQTSAAYKADYEVYTDNFQTEFGLPFAFTGEFGSFAYVGVPGSETSPKNARCQFGGNNVTDWGPNFFHALRWLDTDEYDFGTESTGGSVANGGFLSLISCVSMTFVPIGSPTSFRNIMSHGYEALRGEFYDSVTQSNYEVRPQRVTSNIGPGAPFAALAPITVNLSMKGSTNQGEGCARLQIQGIDPAFDTIALDGIAGGPHIIETTDRFDLGGFTGNRRHSYGYFIERVLWGGESGYWSGDNTTDNSERLEEIQKIIQVDPQNAIPLP